MGLLASILSYAFVLQMQKGQIFSGALLPQPPPGFSHEPASELAVPRDPQLHFATFENSISVQKRTLGKLLG